MNSQEQATASYVFLIQMDVAGDTEDLFLKLFREEHAPQLLALEGVRSCTQLKLERGSGEGTRKYAAIYEVDSPDIVGNEAWKEAANRGGWPTLIRPKLSNVSQTIYRKL